MADEKVFLTDSRREVLNGEYDGADNVRRTHKTRIRSKSRTALSELIDVATSPEIDNSDVFEPEQIRVLLTTLLVGSGGFEDDDMPTYMQAWEPDPDYANSVYVAADRALRNGPEL